MEPQQRLPRGPEFLDLVEDERNGLLHTSIRILLVAITDLHKTDRRRHNQFAAAGLLVACRERALSQKVQLILVEAALQPQKQSVVAMPRSIDSFLVNQHRVDDATHLNQLLPIPAI